VIANYRMTVAANRPSLASDGLIVRAKTNPPIEISFHNVGKATARRGTATLFSLSEAEGVPEKIGSVAIGGAGANIVAGSGAWARFDPQSLEAALFLVCISYFDDAGTRFEQAFLFQRPTDASPMSMGYEELAPPDVGRCAIANHH
jgi:hypothetical protein